MVSLSEACVASLDSREIETMIRTAFAGVTLGAGISMRQAQWIDGHPYDEPDDFDALKRSDVVDDWTKIPLADLVRNNLPHMDAAGLRYYLPAYMLALLRDYDPLSERDIGTMGTLDGRIPRNIERYALLSEDQKAAVAHYVKILPELVALDTEDAAIVERALRDYWGKFLSSRTNPRPDPRS
jgi:uncharacterized protein DUF6714